MEEIDLTSPEYWENSGADIRLNPRLRFETGGLAEFVTSELGLGAATVFATSGTTGSGPRFVILERRAILASAEAVNRHLGVSEIDRWLCALTTFHVGGLAVWARAWKAGCPVFAIDGEHWDRSGDTFVKACRDHEITLTALTPTHLHDVVANRHAAPDTLRAVLIGGGALEEALLGEAVRLGWPILRTYGMTEAASQIATDPREIAHDAERSVCLPVIPDWKVREGEGERLEIAGPALFHGYAIRDVQSRAWSLERPLADDGFFATSDRVRIAESNTGPVSLAFEGRVDDRVKKLGEIVSLGALRRTLGHCLPGHTATILARPHDRLGNELVAVIERTDSEESVVDGIGRYNALVAPFERIDRVGIIDEMPRTGLGKIAHGPIGELLESGQFTPIGEPPFSS